MKRSLRFIALILSALFLIAGAMTVVCYADDEPVNQQPVDQQPVDQQPVDPVPAVDPAPAADPEPANDPAPVEEPQNVDNSGSNNGYDNSNGSGYTNEEPNYYVEDSDPMYYGDASNYDYNANVHQDVPAGAVSSQTTLYNSSGMSAEDAAPNEWSDIVLDEKTVKTGVADFSAIKSNTETKDNGDWILYVGYVLLGLSALGILYFIVATIVHRKKAKKEAARMERRRSASPARSEAARMEERERRESAPARRTSRFADENPGYSRRASSRADTDEVYIPRRAAKKH